MNRLTREPRYNPALAPLDGLSNGVKLGLPTGFQDSSFLLAPYLVRNGVSDGIEVGRPVVTG